MKRGGPLRRTPLARGSSALARTGRLATRGAPLPARSAKRTAEVERRREVCLEVILRDRGCVAHRSGAPGYCWHPDGQPLDVHEIVTRARWAAGYLEPSNCISICRMAHDWIHDHPKEATALGLLASRPPGNGYTPSGMVGA